MQWNLGILMWLELLPSSIFNHLIESQTYTFKVKKHFRGMIYSRKWFLLTHLGIEPRISCLEGRRVIHYANGSEIHQTGIGPVLRVWKTLILPLNYWCEVVTTGVEPARRKPMGLKSISFTVRTRHYPLLVCLM